MVAKKEMRTTTFGELRMKEPFMFVGEYLQRGMFDNPKQPMWYVKVSPRMYIEERMLEKGRIPKERLKDIARQTTTNHAVIIKKR
jgi:hypothetical protein